MIKAAYQLRKSHYASEAEEGIEITQELKNEIDQVLAYKSRCRCIIDYTSNSWQSTGVTQDQG
jgi:hypothetical protein